MQKSLYFICPTDCLETIINRTFKQQNYFCTSLGNSIAFDEKMTWEVKKLIDEKDIAEIFFVLSEDNRVVLDATKNHHYSEIRGLSGFYAHIRKNKEQSETSWQTPNLHLMLSYHLNSKIKELELKFEDYSLKPLRITGLIYNRQQEHFYDIYSDLVCVEYLNLN